MTWAQSDHDDEQAHGTGGIWVWAGGELRLRKRRQSVRCRNNTKRESGFEKRDRRSPWTRTNVSVINSEAGANNSNL